MDKHVVVNEMGSLLRAVALVLLMMLGFAGSMSLPKANAGLSGVASLYIVDFNLHKGEWFGFMGSRSMVYFQVDYYWPLIGWALGVGSEWDTRTYPPPGGWKTHVETNQWYTVNYENQVTYNLATFTQGYGVTFEFRAYKNGWPWDDKLFDQAYSFSGPGHYEKRIGNNDIEFDIVFEWQPCTGGQSWDGANCSCPAEQYWNGQQCVQCSGGQIWDGSQCTCPAGQNWNGQQCIQCGEGQYWDGSRCTCPSGQDWNGQRCYTPTPTCYGGQYWDGSRCTCPSGQDWNGQRCYTPQPPPSNGCGSSQIWSIEGGDIRVFSMSPQSETTNVWIYAFPMQFLGQDPTTQIPSQYDVGAVIAVTYCQNGNSMRDNMRTPISLSADRGTDITLSVLSPSGFACVWDHYGYGQARACTLNIQVTQNDKIVAYFQSMNDQGNGNVVYARELIIAATPSARPKCGSDMLVPLS